MEMLEVPKAVTSLCNTTTGARHQVGRLVCIRRTAVHGACWGDGGGEIWRVGVDGWLRNRGLQVN